MRKFDVFVRPKKKTLVYSDLTGVKAIKLMESLTERGFKPICRTEANNFVEYLDIKQMKESVI